MFAYIRNKNAIFQQVFIQLSDNRFSENQNTCYI